MGYAGEIAEAFAELRRSQEQVLEAVQAAERATGALTALLDVVSPDGWLSLTFDSALRFTSTSGSEGWALEDPSLILGRTLREAFPDDAADLEARYRASLAGRTEFQYSFGGALWECRGKPITGGAVLFFRRVGVGRE